MVMVGPGSRPAMNYMTPAPAIPTKITDKKKSLKNLTL